ncbi:hypothetical protein AMEX_G17250 [Astyanax mexicanus]|uniref:Uncharacterized protein n=1 Tax=Astyanax mexicanus TaxID=7994 RepID=A0A8T2LHC5_ASTMX|nr:hypothetical protein AMEX_G17250 [Astyanax mexicanus]
MASDNLKTKEMVFLQKLSETLDIMVSSKSAFKGAFIGMVCSGAGGLIGGPAGLVAGFAAGGVLGYMVNLSVPLTEHLKKQTPEWLQKLCADLRKLLEDLFWSSVDFMVEKVVRDEKLKNKTVEFLKDFLKKTSNVTVSLSAA